VGEQRLRVRCTLPIADDITVQLERPAVRVLGLRRTNMVIFRNYDLRRNALIPENHHVGRGNTVVGNTLTSSQSIQHKPFALEQ
jgi:hypothetical protein